MTLRPLSSALSPQNFWLMFGGIWLLGGAPFLVAGIYFGIAQVMLDHRLEANGHTVQGMVLTKTISSSKGSSPNYSITFRFVPRNGPPVKGETRISRVVWEELTEREPIAVTYVPDHPSSYRVESQESDWMLAVIFTILGGFFTSAGGFVFIRGLARIRRSSRLEREGVVTQGTVLDVGPGQLTINGVPQWAVRYRYQDHAGRTHMASSDSLAPEAAQVWNVGDTGTVRFDRQHPQESTWIGRA